MDPTEWDRDGIGGPEQPGPADKASGTGKPVANLLDQYLTKRTALMAEVEHLAQLRDQVRGAADRETLDIVGKARQDAREVIAAARRELFGPSEQVRAVLGDSESVRVAEFRPDPTPQLAFVETSTPGLSVSVIPDKGARRETPKREDCWADFDSLVSENESSQL